MKMSFRATALGDGSSAVSFESFRADTNPNSFLYYRNSAFSTVYGASSSISSSIQGTQQQPFPYQLRTGPPYANIEAGPPPPYEWPNNYLYCNKNYHQIEPTAPPVEPHLEWDSEGMSPSYEGKDGEQDQDQEGEDSPDFSELNEFEKQINVDEPIDDRDYKVWELRQQVGLLEQEKMKQEEITRQLKSELRQAKQGQDEVEVELLHPTYSELMGENRELTKEKENRFLEIKEMKKQLKIMKRDKELAENEKEETLLLWSKAKAEVFSEKARFCEKEEERWKAYMQAKKDKEKAERERDSMADELRNKLTAANDKINLLTEEIIVKDERYEKACRARDGTSLRLLDETLVQTSSVEQLKEHLLSVQALFDKASTERQALRLCLEGKEKELQELEESLSDKEAEKDTLIDKVVVAEDDIETLQEEKKVLEEKLGILEGELKVVREEVKKKEYEVEKLHKENEIMRREVESSKIMRGIMENSWFQARMELTELKQKMKEKEGELRVREGECKNIASNAGYLVANMHKRYLEKEDGIGESGKRAKVYSIRANGKVRQMMNELKVTCMEMGTIGVRTGEMDDDQGKMGKIDSEKILEGDRATDELYGMD
ncbi:unnamed protein product [Orchesella dallaii]|uniref:Uncharacterized protein n=1 Tax=Orchesella dallaii TaxID=48710 RepID=A0ABP1S765_9HEXA